MSSKYFYINVLIDLDIGDKFRLFGLYLEKNQFLVFAKTFSQISVISHDFACDFLKYVKTQIFF